MARFVRLRAELFSGIAYWGEPEYYQAGPGHVHVTDEFRSYVDHLGSGVETSLQGVCIRVSGEHGTIWMPVPERTTFVACGPVLGTVLSYREGAAWDAFLQPTLGFFFNAVGSVFALERSDLMSALTHRIAIGSYATLQAAQDAVKLHAEPYSDATRRVPYPYG